jgi:hypothetical protein
MAQVGRGLGFAKEPLDPARCVAAIELGHLQSNGSIELRIMGLVHIAECAFPQLAANNKSANARPCRSSFGRVLRADKCLSDIGLDVPGVGFEIARLIFALGRLDFVTIRTAQFAIGWSNIVGLPEFAALRITARK